MHRSIDLNDVRLLMQVVEHGSFTAAARATGVPKSTISQRIAALERAAGTGLLRRTSRSLSLTEAGAALLPHARAIEDLTRRVELSLLERDGELQGTLRISCSNGLAQFALASIIPLFLTRHPRAAIRVEASNRLVDLIGEGFDLALRGHVGPLKDSSIRQRVVAHASWSLVASPGWIAAHRAPTAPEDVAAGEILCFSPYAPDHQGWRLRRGDEERLLQVEPRLVANDMATLRAAAVAGGGVVGLPSYVLREPLRAGLLVPVLPEWAPEPSSISVLTPPRAQSSRLAAAFSDFLASELSRVMEAEIEARPAADALPEGRTDIGTVHP